MREGEKVVAPGKSGSMIISSRVFTDDSQLENVTVRENDGRISKTRVLQHCAGVRVNVNVKKKK